MQWDELDPEEIADSSKDVVAAKNSKQIKLDLDTPMETFFFGAMQVFGGAGILILFHYFSGIKNAKFFILPDLIGFLIFFILYRNSDNYYIVDISRKSLLYHFKLFSWETETLFARFSEISAVSTAGTEKSSKYSRWWEYATIICLKSGKLFLVSDYKKEGFPEADRLACKVGKIFNAPYIQGKPHHFARALREADGTYTITHFEKQLNWSLLVGILIIIVFTLLIFSGILQ